MNNNVPQQASPETFTSSPMDKWISLLSFASFFSLSMTGTAVVIALVTGTILGPVILLGGTLCAFFFLSAFVLDLVHRSLFHHRLKKEGR